MENFFWTLAAALVVGLAALALKRPFLYVKLALIGYHLGGWIAIFGLGRLSGGASYGLEIFGAAVGLMGYLYALGHFAAASLNSAKEERSGHDASGGP